MKVLLISACLVGLNCRFDGKSKKLEIVESLKEKFILVPVCPEQLGGLPTPRKPAMFDVGDGEKLLKGLSRLLDENGKDVSQNFVRGAFETLKVARLYKERLFGCLMKERSPSCGVNSVYINGKLSKGCGVSVALLKAKGYKIVSSEEAEKLLT